MSSTPATPNTIESRPPAATASFPDRVVERRRRAGDAELWGQSYWRALYYFNLYRLALATGFLMLGLNRNVISLIGERSPRLFVAASIAMGAMAIFNLITITRGQPGFRTQAHIQFSVDVVLITVLSFASGGVASGLSLLLIVSVAAAGVVLSGRMTLFFAALAASLTFAEHILSRALFLYVDGSYTQVGLIGVGLFTTGLLLYFVSYRIRRAEEIAKDQATDLANLAQLNELVVARLQTGVLVVDGNERISLTNLSARDLLGSGHGLAGDALERVSPPLAERLREWKRRPHANADTLRLREGGLTVAARFVAIGSNVAIFLEDISVSERHAQQLKLAALGRLTAAVAHEIRNPLGAISHAGQLARESPRLNDEDQQLLGIVVKQSERINGIIKSILHLGRPGAATMIHLDLDRWLADFRRSYAEAHGRNPRKLVCTGEGVGVCVDPDQLGQILSNLCDNAFRHGNPNADVPVVTLQSGWIEPGRIPFLDVIDNGPGIPKDALDKIFEPFFTTHGRGLGLGLFLARELCQNNFGRLDYVPGAEGGGRFRIQFAPIETCGPAI